MSAARENGQAPFGALPGRIGQPARAERDTHQQYTRPLGAAPATDAAPALVPLRHARPFRCTDADAPAPSLDRIRTAEGDAFCESCHLWGDHGPECPDDPQLAEKAERTRYRVVTLMRPVGWLVLLDDRDTRKVFAVIVNHGHTYCFDCWQDDCEHCGIAKLEDLGR